MGRVNLPTDVLRTFLAVVDLESFTRAGEVLGRSQPAISLQIRRLEDQLGTKLIDAAGRRLVVTESGRALATFARRIIALNDQAVAHLACRSGPRALRVGLPTDYAVAFLQRSVTEFRDRQASVDLEIVCDLSRRLLDGLLRNQLDVVVALARDGLEPYSVRAWTEQPLWVASRRWTATPGEPVPLVAHPEGCEYRARMIEALSRDQRPWRIVFCSPGISGLQSAVAAGLGVTALTRATLTPEMRVLEEGAGLPPLAQIRVGIYCPDRPTAERAQLLIEHLLARLEAATPRRTAVAIGEHE